MNQMRELTLPDIRNIQLRILKYVADFCDRENLVYYLGYGTLLGAVRHKGYIPWDDDIDIVMPRRDYETFIKSFSSSKYAVKSHYLDAKYPFPYVKVSFENSVLKENMDIHYDLGINIDVFPLDEFPASKAQRKKLYNQIDILQKILQIKIITPNPNRKFYKNIILRIGKILLTPISYSYIIKKINSKAMTYNENQDRSYMGCVLESYSIDDIMEKVVFGDRTTLEFEGHKFLAPEKYHEYLSNMYGNYMELPPEEYRKTHHDYKAFLM